MAEVNAYGDYSQRPVYAMIEGMSQSDQHSNLQDTNRQELYAIVVGRVQGVGFRYFVVQSALTLGLRGYARNDSNGDVEVVAQGPAPALTSLLAILRQGPSAANVQEVRTTWRDPIAHFSGFHIRW